MTRFRPFFRLLLVSMGALILILVMTSLAAAEADLFLGIFFHPFTLDGDNGTCVPWTDSQIGQTRNCDPINLAFPGRTWVEVRDLLLGQGWTTSGLGSGQWLHYDGASTYGENEQLFKSDGSGRYHIRLWQAPGGTLVTLGAVHHETSLLHTINMSWEQAESDVADQLCAPYCEQTGLLTEQDYIQGGDGEWRGWDNNGSATVIPAPASPGTPPTISIFNPSGASPVSGQVTVQIEANDAEDAAGTLTVEWNINGGAWQATTYNSGSSYYEASWDSTAIPDGGHIFNARAMDSGNNSTGASENITVDNLNDPPQTTMHIGDLAGTGLNVKKNWQAQVSVVVHNAGEGPVAGATVDGFWSGDVSGTGSCTSDNSGTCTLLSSTMLKKGTERAIFSVTAVTHASLTYTEGSNHDPQGDSSGSAIQVNKDSSTQDPGAMPNQPPVASFTYSCNDGSLICDFDAGNSSDPDGSIESYVWNFGEGDPGSSQTASHTFSTAGSYTVILTVTDNDGAPGQEQQEVSVGLPASDLTLSASGTKVKGVQQAELTWSGANSANIDIFRDGGLIGTVASGASPYTDNIGQKGGGSYLYQVCEAGTSNCSNEAPVEF